MFVENFQSKRHCSSSTKHSTLVIPCIIPMWKVLLLVSLYRWGWLRLREVMWPAQGRTTSKHSRTWTQVFASKCLLLSFYCFSWKMLGKYLWNKWMILSSGQEPGLSSCGVRPPVTVPQTGWLKDSILHTGLENRQSGFTAQAWAIHPRWGGLQEAGTLWQLAALWDVAGRGSGAGNQSRTPQPPTSASPGAMWGGTSLQPCLLVGEHRIQAKFN